MGKRLRRLKEKASGLGDHRKCPEKEKPRDRQPQMDFQMPKLSRISYS
jgi:hypothetical protein